MTILTKIEKTKESTTYYQKFDDKWLIHREDGPAIKYPNGTKIWCFENKRHREDGPAIECADGTKFWYFKGKRHREDGPASEYATGTKKWFFKGMLHREDGPAIERTSGDNEYFLNDKEYTKEEYDKEIIALTTKIETICGDNFYYKKINGEWLSHREDGPAIERDDGNNEYFLNHIEYTKEEYDKEIMALTNKVEKIDGDTFYYKKINGKYTLLHREDGPAIERDDGTKKWYFEGNLHREDGPAIEQKDGSKEWYFERQLHRTDGPAIERADGTKYWYFKDQRHREDGPAMECPDGTKYWFIKGKKMTEEEFNEKIKKLNDTKQSNDGTKSAKTDKENSCTETILSIQKRYLENLLKEYGFQESIFQEIAKILELERTT